MRMRVFASFLILIIFITNGYTQFISDNRIELRSIFSAYDDPVNMLQFGENPAWLFFDGNQIPLELYGDYSGQSGDFHKPFDPGTRDTYQYYVQGARILDEHHAVKGQFGFLQDFRGDWRWMMTRDYDNGNPFVLADSTTGRTVYRGISMNAMYGVPLTDRIAVGTQIKYAIDNGLKEVSPKPISTIRDLQFSIGTVYHVSQQFQVGASFAHFDQQEEISYQEDEVDPLTETILLKFRGIDRFLRVSKQREFRESRWRDYSGRIHMSGSLNNGLTYTAYGGLTTGNIDVRDGRTSPDDQGYWYREGYDAGVRLYYPLDRYAFGFTSEVNYTDHWARHPRFEVVLSEGSDRFQMLALGIERSLGGVLEMLGGEYGIIHHGKQVNDYLSKVDVDISRLIHEASIGSRWKFTENFSTTLLYTFSWQTAQNDIIEAPNPSPFFSDVRIYEFEYYCSAANRHSFQAESHIGTSRIGTIVLGLRLDRIDVTSSDYFHDSHLTAITARVGLMGI